MSIDSSLVGHATVIVAEGKLILFNDLGELILARATKQRFEELARASVLGGEICWTQPALSRGRLFVRNQSRAACLFLGVPETLQAGLLERAISTSGIPQVEYFDWASLLLGVEPEYALVIPSRAWLIQWYEVCLIGIMGGSLLIVLTACAFSRFRRTVFATKETLFWLLVFVAGGIGTTFLSPAMNVFVFTWPVSLFAAYQGLMDRISVSRQTLTRRDRMRSGAACFLFVGCCLLYFLVCRRLSLVFEWVFLVGFVAAVPFPVVGKLVFASRRWHGVWKSLFSVFAFSACYWSSILFLHARVQ